MRALARGALMASLASVGAGAAVDSGAQAPTLRARVDVVTIDAYVHHDGRPVEGLTAADFLVRDKGVEQELRALGTTDSAHVIVALDVSGSVTGDVRRRLDDALRRLLTRLTPVDRLSLITFAGQVPHPSRGRGT